MSIIKVTRRSFFNDAIYARLGFSLMLLLRTYNANTTSRSQDRSDKLVAIWISFENLLPPTYTHTKDIAFECHL